MCNTLGRSVIEKKIEPMYGNKHCYRAPLEANTCSVNYGRAVWQGGMLHYLLPGIIMAGSLPDKIENNPSYDLSRCISSNLIPINQYLNSTVLGTAVRLSKVAPFMTLGIGILHPPLSAACSRHR